MAAITTRAGKGAALTNDEMDANFTNLNTSKMEKSSNLGDLANAAQARNNLGLGNVDNTSDANKPVSTAAQTALDGKQDKTTAVTKDSATGAATIPVGTTAQRPAPLDGMFRFSSTLAEYEIVTGGVWDTVLRAAKIGVTIQPFDANTVKKNVANTFSASQRGTVTTANTASYDLNLANNFITTLAATQTLAFSNLVSGQSGNIIFINGSNYVVAKNSYVKCTSSALSMLSATGTYWVSYICDGTNVYLSVSGALS